MQLFQRKKYTAAPPHTARHVNKKTRRIAYFLCSRRATFSTDLSLFIISVYTIAIQSKFVILDLSATINHDIKRETRISGTSTANPTNNARCYLTKYYTLQSSKRQQCKDINLPFPRGTVNYPHAEIIGNASYT